MSAQVVDASAGAHVYGRAARRVKLVEEKVRLEGGALGKIRDVEGEVREQLLSTLTVNTARVI
jgi:hypothetical protein